MKIFINDLKISLPVDVTIHSFIAHWFPAINNHLIRVNDRKLNLEIDAQYYCETFNEFCDYFRLYTAGSVLLGGALMVAESAYRIQALNKNAVSKMSAESLIKDPDFLAYTKSPEFETTFNNAVNPTKTTEPDLIASEMCRMALIIGELTFNEQLVPNVEKAIKASDQIIKSSLLVSINNEGNNQRYLSVKITSTGEYAYIGFNASEEDYRLLDKWLNIPDLKLNKTPNSHDIGEVDTLHDFTVWFNTLRLVIESELSHETLLDGLSLLDFETFARCKKNVADRVLQISSINTISKYEVRKQVVEYLFEMLNSQKNIKQKVFEELYPEKIKKNFDTSNKIYYLSLYQ